MSISSCCDCSTLIIQAKNSAFVDVYNYKKTTFVLSLDFIEYKDCLDEKCTYFCRYIQRERGKIPEISFQLKYYRSHQNVITVSITHKQKKM